MRTMYVLVNESLKMSTGKACSQVAHAVAELAANTPNWNFGATNPSRIIVLSAKDDLQMRHIADYLADLGIDTSLYIDEGDYETIPFSVTAMAITPSKGPFDETVEKLLERFDLYPKRHFWK